MTAPRDGVVVVGGGLAGLRAVETLRRLGHEDRVVLVQGEPELPYDRPPLSKEVLRGERSAGDVVFRDAAFFADLGVELVEGPATALDLVGRRVTVAGRELAYEHCLVCTGADARRLPASVVDPALDGVCLVRDLADARRLRGLLADASHLVVIGAGFIGAEVASSARALGLEVTLLEALGMPLVRALGPEMAAACAGLHAEHGARLICDARVEAIEGAGRVERVRLADGRTIDCDLVVAGIGAVPATGWLAGSGLTLADGIVCDEALRAGPGVWAAGDVAWWPNGLFGDGMRCEQWTNAVEQGRHVARAILAGEHDAPVPFRGSNYFWSDQYGVRIQFAGITHADEVVVAAGDVEQRAFLALYRRGDRVVGALAMRRAKQLMRAKLLVERSTPWDEALAELSEEAAA